MSSSFVLEKNVGNIFSDHITGRLNGTPKKKAEQIPTDSANSFGKEYCSNRITRTVIFGNYCDYFNRKDMAGS